jgi:hypothetical protein
MDETQRKYYDSTLKRYKRDGEDMIIWSVYNGRNIDGTVNRSYVKIKDLDDNRIKEGIRKSKNYNCAPVGITRIEILNDVILKRRIKKIEKICSKLEI